MRVISRIGAMGLAGLLLGLTACEQALFPRDLPRTQYQRHDQLRGRDVQAEELDDRGIRRPALRERLGSHRH